MASNKEAPKRMRKKEDEEDHIKVENSVTVQQSSIMTLTKLVRNNSSQDKVQIEQEVNNKLAGMINQQNNQIEEKKTSVKRKVKLTSQKRKITARTKFLSDSKNNNYVMHNFHHPESPLQEESGDNGEKVEANDSMPDFRVEQNIMATIATSLIELNPIQTNTTTASTTTTPDVLTEEQMSNVVDDEDEDDDEEDEEKEHSDGDEKVTIHNQLNHQSHHHLNNHQHRIRQTSVGLEQRKHDIKITDAQLDRISSLIKIIRNGNYNEFLEALESRGFKNNLLNIFIDGQTALHYSLIYGRSLAWCKQLVINGANPNLTNRAGWHPIHLAAFNGSRETMRYLIDCIAN